MKRLIYILSFAIFLQMNAQTFNSGQKWTDFHTNKNALSHPVPTNIQKNFDIAINEISQMLKRREKKSEALRRRNAELLKAVKLSTQEETPSDEGSDGSETKSDSDKSS